MVVDLLALISKRWTSIDKLGFLAAFGEFPTARLVSQQILGYPHFALTQIKQSLIMSNRCGGTQAKVSFYIREEIST